jgi:hypothetical protein
VKVLISIYLTDDKMQVPYQMAAEKLLRSKYPGLYCFNLDNHSATEMLDHALQLLMQEEEVLVVMEAGREGTDVSRLLKLINYMVRKKADNHCLVLVGAHPVLQKMGKALGGYFYRAEKVEDVLQPAARLFS